jgi:hypothetical protein
MAIQDILHSETGGIIISIILGLGLAALFRRVCKGNNCVVIKGPSLAEVNKYYYKIQEDCFKYTPYVVPCDDDKSS